MGLTDHGAVRWIFGAHGQLLVGVLVFVVSTLFWLIGLFVIPHALAAPWHWTPAVFIFHASMFALVLASYGIVATALSYRATERVETAVVETIESADTVEVKN